jgi:hypothetical protein
MIIQVIIIIIRIQMPVKTRMMMKKMGMKMIIQNMRILSLIKLVKTLNESYFTSYS